MTIEINFFNLKLLYSNSECKNEKNIDKKFKELRWINPISKLSPSNEIKIIKEAKEILINDKKKTYVNFTLFFF